MSAHDKLLGLSARPKIAVHKFSSCDGCQLALINDAVSLIELSSLVDVVHFAEAGPLDEFAEVDLAIIEGSVNTKHDIHRLEKIRAQAKYLLCIGACALTGGIQGLRNFTNPQQLLHWQHDIYPQETQIVIDEDLATAKAIHEYVNVDFEIPGCPVTSAQIMHAIRSILFGVEPEKNVDPVCTSCKHAGVTCVMVAKNEPCLGPVVANGCEALCPKLGRGCYGCYGSSKYANMDAMKNKLREMGLTEQQIMHKFHHINSQDAKFKGE
ncbi:MAG: hypothetical protein RLZZ293_359 [Pseudomonadota bacterium]|jgi:coenzyme F420-reducing hydrogenase gamma subunit